MSIQKFYSLNWSIIYLVVCCLLWICNKVWSILIGEGTITCTTSGRGNVIFGDSNGQVWLYNRHWESTCVGGWEAGPVEQLVLPRLSNHLFGLGCEAGVRCIKVWDLEKDCAQVCCILICLALIFYKLICA